LDDVLPLVFRFDHERHDDGVLRILLLRLVDLFEVRLERAIGDELDVVEARAADAADVRRAETRRDVLNRLTERLPHGAPPARFKRALQLARGVRRRRAREPERVRRLDAAAVRLETRHYLAPVKNA